MNLLENINTEMKPEEFEIYCLQLLENIKNELIDCKIQFHAIFTDISLFQNIIL